MLALSATSLAFSAPALLPRTSPLSRVGVITAQNEMEPEEGWNVDNLMGMMDEADETMGGPKVADIYEKPVFVVKDMEGITAPLGFFDPAGFTEGATEGRIRFYREVELKHGRVAMLASLGFLVAEQFHPLWGGDIDVPSYIAFQETPLQTFWPAVIMVISIIEVFSVFTFNGPAEGFEPWSIKSTHEAGNLGFDPLGLKPSGAAALADMKNRELNNGRLAMLAAAGMIAQEFVSHQKLF